MTIDSFAVDTLCVSSITRHLTKRDEIISNKFFFTPKKKYRDVTLILIQCLLMFVGFREIDTFCRPNLCEIALRSIALAALQLIFMLRFN